MTVLYNGVIVWSTAVYFQLTTDVNLWTKCLTHLLIYECSLDVMGTSTAVFDCRNVLPCMFSPTWDLRFCRQYVNGAEGRDTVAHLKWFFPTESNFSSACILRTQTCRSLNAAPSGNSFLVQWGDLVCVYRNLLKGCVSLNALWNCSWSSSDISGSWKTIIMSTQLWLFMRNPYELETNWIWCVFLWSILNMVRIFFPSKCAPLSTMLPKCVFFFSCPSGLMFS